MQGINILDYATLSVAASIVGLADSDPVLPAAAKRVYITCESYDVRWRADGTDPATDEGHPLAADDSISFTNGNYRSLLEKIRFSKVTSTAALKITYFD